MNLDRIKKVIDVVRMAAACVAVVGVGGAANLCRNLVRCGIKRLILIDFDTVEAANVCRQEHMADQVGLAKVAALAAELRRINPGVEVVCLPRDVTAVTDVEAPGLLGGAGVLVAATDSHAAQARVNQLALLLNTPAVFIGLYERGEGGEVAFWRPGLPTCYHCLCAARYEAQAASPGDPASDSATVIDVQILDGIAAQVVIGLLTAGSDNRFGRLVARLGDRQFLQLKIDPDWTFAGADPVRASLGVPEGNDAYVAFCTAAVRDPEPGGQCPDCIKYRRPTGTAAVPYATWR